ncbi:MAG: hypothetical protein KA280_09210 [Thermomonas sp.]|nr:hypothetical protein [Thermomonas sp.]
MRSIRLACLGCGVALASVAAAAPIGTTFVYQGLLKDDNVAVTGLYDLQVCLFEDPATPVPLACVPDFDDVPVEDGIFTVPLDFGSAAFAGELRYLELRVRPGAGGAYTIMTPRQAIRPAPEALRAATSSTAPWSGLSGVPAGFADGLDNDTNSGGTVTQVVAGAGLSGGAITASGTIAIAGAGVQQSMIAAAAVGSGQLQDNAVTSAKLADDSVRLVKLAADSVDSARVVNGSLGGVDIATGAIGLAQINTEQVQARVAASCPAGQYFRGIQANGALNCEPLPGLTVATTVDGGAPNVGTWNDIAIPPDGRPVVSYYDATNGNLKFARCANTACTGIAAALTVDASANDVGQYSAIAIGADGLPVISYYDNTADDLRALKCGNADCSAGNTLTLVDGTGNVGLGSVIAVGIDGNPIIAYGNHVGPFAYDGAFKAAKCANPACSGAATITTFHGPGVGVGPSLTPASSMSIAIPADGLPVIAYATFNVSNNTTPRLAKCANANCTGAATLRLLHGEPGVNLGAYASIALGAGELPIVAYQANGNSLGIVRCNNASCSAPAFEVDFSADTAYVDIAVGSDGIPTISAQDPVTDDLVVTRCLASDCSQTGTEPYSAQFAVDGNGGAHTSIAIGADGLPVIAFEDGGDLRVVKCGNRSCQ